MQLHLMTKEIMNISTTLFKYLPIWMIDKLVLLMCYLVFGDTSKYGLRRPAIGPFSRKLQNNVYPVIDVGTYNKIKSGQIQVLCEAFFICIKRKFFRNVVVINTFEKCSGGNGFQMCLVVKKFSLASFRNSLKFSERCDLQVLPAMKGINGNVVEFADGRQFPFDAIVFATGYRSAAKKWLKVSISFCRYGKA